MGHSLNYRGKVVSESSKKRKSRKENPLKWDQWKMSDEKSITIIKEGWGCKEKRVEDKAFGVSTIYHM